MKDWSSIIGILFFLLVAILFPLIFRRRRKEEGVKNREGFYQHLREIGLEASLPEGSDDREKIGLGRVSAQRSEGIIGLEDRNIDSINVVSESTQYGTRYFIDYLVKSPNVMGERILKKTRLTKKKSPPIWGKVVAIDWKGDNSLAQSLNLDYSLEDKLLRAALNAFKGIIWILPEPKHGYVRIRTDYFLPSAEIFRAISAIAKHIKSW